MPIERLSKPISEYIANFDLAGWSTLADGYGFALLLPEQQRSNNPNGCFNCPSTVGAIEANRFQFDR